MVKHLLNKTSLLATLLIATFPTSINAQTYLPEQIPGWCKNEVLDRYDTNNADINITGVNGNEVTWKLNSTGRSGKCVFNEKNEFVRIVVDEEHYKATGAIYWNAQVENWIAPDGGVCHTCTPENGFPTPPPTQDGFFYLPNEGLWYDPDGHECNTCTPENGFPIPVS